MLIGDCGAHLWLLFCSLSLFFVSFCAISWASFIARVHYSWACRKRKKRRLIWGARGAWTYTKTQVVSWRADQSIDLLVSARARVCDKWNCHTRRTSKHAANTHTHFFPLLWILQISHDNFFLLSCVYLWMFFCSLSLRNSFYSSINLYTRAQ